MMKAAVLTKFNQPLVIEERKIIPLRDSEVLVRISASGICGSDVHMWKGKDPRTPLPIILGHEGVGIVEDVKGCKFEQVFYKLILDQEDGFLACKIR